MDSLLLEKRDFIIATSKEIIEAKLLAFYEKMNKIAAFLKDHKAPADIQIDPKKVYLECYIDKPAITRLINIAMQDDFAQFAVFFGLEDPVDHDRAASASFGQLTTCFLGLDENQNILGCHFPDSSASRTAGKVIDGEDTWPPPPINGAAKGVVAELPFDPDKAFTLASDEDDVEDYFDQEPE